MPAQGTGFGLFLHQSQCSLFWLQGQDSCCAQLWLELHFNSNRENRNKDFSGIHKGVWQRDLYWSQMNSRCKIWGDGTIMIGRAHVRCFYPPCAGGHQASVLANSVLAGEVGGGELGWGGWR